MASESKGLSWGMTLVIYFFIVFWGLLASLRLLWEIIKHPLESFKKTERTTVPACLQDPSLGTHEYVKANGIKFHCVRSGDRSKPLMLLLHGFPEVRSTRSRVCGIKLTIEKMCWWVRVDHR